MTVTNSVWYVKLSCSLGYHYLVVKGGGGEGTKF